jgi:hypothetical protein
MTSREIRYTTQILYPQFISALIVCAFLFGTAIPAMTSLDLFWDNAFLVVSIFMLGILVLSVLGTMRCPDLLKTMHRLLVEDDIKHMPIYRRMHYLLHGLDWVAVLFWFYAMVLVNVPAWIPALAVSCYLYLGWDYVQTRINVHQLRTEMLETGRRRCD